MKIVQKFFCGLAFVLLTTNCNDFLTQTPISTMAPETYWKTKEDADLWIAGTYKAVQLTFRYGIWDFGEGRSDNFRQAGTGNFQIKVLGNSLSAGDNDVSPNTDWAPLYSTISRCNFGLKYYPQMIEKDIDGGSATYRDYVGQCYGLRAMMYFYGIRVWGRMPLVDVPIESVTQQRFYPRSSMEECKALILSDIDKCIENISTIDRKDYFSLGAAYALQADVYMWFKEYDKALASIQKLETLGYYKWVANANEWKDMFLKPISSKGVIFALVYNPVDDTGSGYASRLGGSGNTSQYMIAPDVYRILVNNNTTAIESEGETIYVRDKKDARWWQCFDTISWPTADIYEAKAGESKCSKYWPWDPSAVRAGSSDLGAFVMDPTGACGVCPVLYRYADIQLLKAEIYCHKKEFDKVRDILNQIRVRVGGDATTFSASDTPDFKTTYNLVMTERQLELFGEGRRWFDLVRADDESGKLYNYFHEVMDPVMVKRKGADFLGANEGRILTPIRATAFTANPALSGDQNPPYTE